MQYLVPNERESGGKEPRTRACRRKRGARGNDDPARPACRLRKAASGTLPGGRAEPSPGACEHPHPVRRALAGGMHRVRVQPRSRRPGGRVRHHEGRLPQPWPGRAAGAPWSLSMDAFGHGPIVDLALMFDWIDAVLTAPVPATAGAPLRAMTETGGWL